MKSVLSVKGKKFFKSLFSCLLAITLICSSSISSFAYGGSHTYYPTIENIPLNNPVWNFVKNDFIYPFFDGIYDTMTFNDNSNMKWLNDINPLTQAIKYFVPQTTHGGGGTYRDPIIVNEDPVQVPRPIIKNNYDYSSHDVTNEIYNIENNSYETVNNTYVYNNDYYIYETDNYYISYEYEINYYSIVVAPISDPTQGKYFKLFYELPDGRSSYNLKPSDIRGTVFIYDVINYERVSTEDNVVGLWHLDGDFYNSVDNRNYSYENHMSTNFQDGRFGGCITNFNGDNNVNFNLDYDSSKLGSDYTLEFWLYVPYQDTVLNSSLVNSTVGITGYRNITFLDSIPQESWNHIAIRSDGTWFVNGNNRGTVPSWLFGSSNSIISVNNGTVNFKVKFAGSYVELGNVSYAQYYGYRFSYDEVKLTNGFSYSSSFEPRLQPWDLTFAYTIPEGEYWEDVQDVQKTETLVFDGFTSNVPYVPDITSNWIRHSAFSQSNQSVGTKDGDVFWVLLNSSTASYFSGPVSDLGSVISVKKLSGNSNVNIYFYDSSWKEIYKTNVGTTLTDINVVGSYYLIFSSSGAISFNLTTNGAPNSFYFDNGIINLDQNVSVDGFIYVPITVNAVIDSVSFNSSYLQNFVIGNSNYLGCYFILDSFFDSTTNLYINDFYISNTPDPSGKIRQIVRNTSSSPIVRSFNNFSISYTEPTIVDSGYNAFSRPTIAIQSPYNVHEAQIGGIRKNNPFVGDVFIDLSDNRATVVSQYYNGVWNAVNGAIFIDGRWYDLLKYDFSTLMLAEESDTDTPTVIIINNYYYGSDSVSGNDFYDPNQTNHPDDPTASDGSLTVLKKISKTLNMWFNAWSIGSGNDVKDIEEQDPDVHWYDLLLPLIYILFLFIALLSVLGLVLNFISYLFHLISVPSFSLNLPDSFIEAFRWLRGETDNPFYLINVAGVQVTTFDFMVLIFEIAFIGSTILIIRKHLNNINVPSYKD